MKSVFNTVKDLAQHIERREEVLKILKESLAQMKAGTEKFAELDDLIKRREVAIKLQKEQLRRMEAKDGQGDNYEGSRDCGWGE